MRGFTVFMLYSGIMRGFVLLGQKKSGLSNKKGFWPFKAHCHFDLIFFFFFFFLKLHNLISIVIQSIFFL